MIGCLSCSTPVPAEAVGAFARCSSCDAQLLVEPFPRMLQPVPKGKPSEPVTTGDEATCFHHPGNRAEVPCDECGCYMCSVCHIEIDGRNLCATCLQHGRGLEPDRMVRERVLWDSVVLSLATLPMLIFYFTIITAPLTLILGFMHRKTPGGLMRGRARWYIGMGLAALQVLGWLTLVGFLVKGILEG